MTPDDQQHSDKTPDRASINRANAQHSTGPKTTAGKEKSRENAWRHGMRSERAVMPGEDPAEFDALRAALRGSHAPMGHHEEALVERIAMAEWKRRRYDTAEAEIFAFTFGAAVFQQSKGKEVPDGLAPASPPVMWAITIGPEKALGLIARYRRTADLDCDRSITQLDRLQRRREKLAREAAEAEAIVRVHAKTNDGLSIASLTKVLLVARRDTRREALGQDAAGPRITGAELAAVGSFGRPNEWPSPVKVASFGQPDETLLRDLQRLGEHRRGPRAVG